jgi:hypothetical protein
MSTAASMRDPRERLMAATRSDGACWTWTGHVQPTGYGVMSYRNRRWYVHRLAWELWRGPIPEGLTIDHLCRNKACINPDHLEPVTHRENNLRGNSVAAQHARKTRCPRGHAYSVSFVRNDGRRERRCSECYRDREREKRRLRLATKEAS